MKRESIILLLWSVYTAVDTSEDKNWSVVQDTIFWTLDKLHVVGNPYEFLDQVNCKHYEKLENFTEFFNECFEE